MSSNSETLGNVPKHQDLIARSLLMRHGIDVFDDPRSVVDIAVHYVQKGSIDPALAVSEGLELPEAEPEAPKITIGSVAIETTDHPLH